MCVARGGTIHPDGHLFEDTILFGNNCFFHSSWLAAFSRVPSPCLKLRFLMADNLFYPVSKIAVMTLTS